MLTTVISQAPWPIKVLLSISDLSDGSDSDRATSEKHNTFVNSSMHSYEDNNLSIINKFDLIECYMSDLVAVYINYKLPNETRTWIV